MRSFLAAKLEAMHSSNPITAAIGRPTTRRPTVRGAGVSSNGGRSQVFVDDVGGAVESGGESISGGGILRDGEDHEPDEDVPIELFDANNSHHVLLRRMAESQDFQMFVVKKAKLYADLDTTKVGPLGHTASHARESKLTSSDYEAFDWLCAYELRRAKQQLR